MTNMAHQDDAILMAVLNATHNLNAAIQDAINAGFTVNAGCQSDGMLTITTKRKPDFYLAKETRNDH